MAAALALALGTAPHPGLLLRPLAAPIAFLIFAVPLAVLLDRLGFFTAAAELLGHGRHLVLGLWVLAALVATILNLDAAVVLLTVGGSIERIHASIPWRSASRRARREPRTFSAGTERLRSDDAGVRKAAARAAGRSRTPRR